VGFADLPALVQAYRGESKTGSGVVALTRGVSFSSSKAQAVEEAKERAAASYRMYSSWDMQEETMVKIHISSESHVDDWAVAGGPQDCVMRFQTLREELGIGYVGVTFLNLPKDPSGYGEYLRRFGEEVIRPLTGP